MRRRALLSPPAFRLALCVILVAACSSGGGDDESTASATAATTTSTTAPLTFPLTGLPDGSGDGQTRPALTVKIDNIDPHSRPQTGLDQADVVYEELTEGGITRFAAVYQSQVPDTIGPVRSVRHMDRGIVSSLGGILVYSGGNPFAIEEVAKAPVNRIDENNAGDAFFRSDDRDAPHNLFARGQALFDFGGEPVPPAPQFTYLTPGVPVVGEPVSSFRVGFDVEGPSGNYGPTYTWDAATGTWKRDIAGVPFVMTDGVQIAPTNVVVQMTYYPQDSEGILAGEGDVLVFTQGQLIRGRWTRPSPDVPATYTDAAGQPILLTPGTTWVELLPNGRLVDVVPATPPAP